MAKTTTLESSFVLVDDYVDQVTADEQDEFVLLSRSVLNAAGDTPILSVPELTQEEIKLLNKGGITTGDHLFMKISSFFKYESLLCFCVINRDWTQWQTLFLTLDGFQSLLHPLLRRHKK